jgi:phosphohistidine phosphatase
MEVYLLRHAVAEDGVPDAERRLTGKGKRDLRRVLRVAKKAGVRPELILTGPLLRAKETAEIAAEVLECGKILETENLLPAADASKLPDELRKLREKSVLLAGHEPNLSSVLAKLLGAPVRVRLRKSALAKVALGEVGALEWLFSPKELP